MSSDRNPDFSGKDFHAFQSMCDDTFGMLDRIASATAQALRNIDAVETLGESPVSPNTPEEDPSAVRCVGEPSSSGGHASSPPSSSAVPVGSQKHQRQQQPVRSRKRCVSEVELADLRGEQAAAESLGLTWKERGPPSEYCETWRGQKFRPGSNRWGNSGGRHKEWRTGYYRAKGKGKAALQEFLASNPKPTAK